MNWKEGLAILASLAAVLGFGLTMLEKVAPEESTPQNSAPPQKIVILARTEFNDSGLAYVEDFDGEIIRLNGSMQVVYLV
jgi:hypothetical protein